MVMQPPVIFGHLRRQIEQLRMESQSRASTQQPLKSTNRIEEHASQIFLWFNDLSEAQKLQPYDIEAIIRLAKLSGYYSPNPSHQHIAAALRRAGFRQFRSWKKIYRNKRLWIWRQINNQTDQD